MIKKTMKQECRRAETSSFCNHHRKNSNKNHQRMLILKGKVQRGRDYLHRVSKCLQKDYFLVAGQDIITIREMGKTWTE